MCVCQGAVTAATIVGTAEAWFPFTKQCWDMGRGRGFSGQGVWGDPNVVATSPSVTLRNRSCVTVLWYWLGMVGELALRVNVTLMGGGNGGNMET